ncbi:LysR family transcriptional regulator [Pseudomonas japonica]|uniref:LysR family transcriptional regulator n=1 Tax=Pseudomonas japonica TaxID=256466 RepID=UPI0015E2E757|nr:LysR family transcriptional regulator [Pseudomonas japonica]MBA1244182.1 LysR family transcriptional regulator [Pseudomonas japonica]
MRELSLDRLRTLVAIADHGSFAAAARWLNLAPPTVTFHIAELEARIGAPLLTRKRGQVHPTAIGDSLLGRARRLLAEADQLIEDIQGEVKGLTGRVRLGASTGALAYLLPEALARLRLEHPGVDVQVEVLTSGESLARLRTGTLDIGLVALPQPIPAGVAVKPWRSDPIMAFVPSAWQAPDPVDARWLAERALILNDPGTQLARVTSEWFAAAGHAPRARIQLNYNDAIKSLVAAGYGAALLPHEGGSPLLDTRIDVRTVQPPLWRPLGIAHRAGAVERATEHVLGALAAIGEQ